MDKKTDIDGNRDGQDENDDNGKKKGPKRKKTAQLPIHKTEILTVGLAVSRVSHTDDTGARHAGKSGYCTHIGNDLFAWFSSTEAKSRINCLECLSQGVERRYVLNGGALEYLARQKRPKPLQLALNDQQVDLDTRDAWEQWLTTHGITRPRHRKRVTEGALMGGLLAQGIPSDLVIMSDDAGQFNSFDHVLCWIHAEPRHQSAHPAQ